MYHSDKALEAYGPYNKKEIEWTTDMLIVKRWQDGNTGIPIVDALMRELNRTGFIPGRGR
jgi:deoxyribodipyrimidine photo-lyase